VINGRALRLPAPNHPGGRRWTGAISVSVLIDEEGNVAAAGATGGPWTYQKVVRSAACDAKFSPTSVRGQPVKVSGVITYNFAR
jgi:protein TonB